MVFFSQSVLKDLQHESLTPKNHALIFSGYKAYYPEINTFPEGNNHLQLSYSHLSMSCIFLQILDKIYILLSIS